MDYGKHPDEILGTINWLLKSAYAVASAGGRAPISAFVAKKVQPLADKLGVPSEAVVREIERRRRGADPSAGQGTLRDRLAQRQSGEPQEPAAPFPEDQLFLLCLIASSPDLAERIVTTSPDVSVSTNLGPWINKTGLFARDQAPDVFRDEDIASAQKWARGPGGRHVELGIAENNLFTFLGALGLSHGLFGQRLLPVGTVYDPFICRGLDALNYACYQDARFMVAATPSGITLAPEGGAHQSIATPLIGMAQDGLASFEPAYVDELRAIMAWSFDYVQREGKKPEAGAAKGGGWEREESGGSVYLRLSTVPLDQPQREMDADLARQVIDGGYWLRKPGPSTSVVIAYTGVVAPQAIAAAGLLAEGLRDVGVLAVTSADRLNAGWQAAGRPRQRGRPGAGAVL